MNATPIQVPGDYYQAIEQRWKRHRNGISGAGFFAKVIDGVLCVRFDGGDEGADGPPDITVPVAVLAPMADHLAGDPRLIESGNWSCIVWPVADVSDGELTILTIDMVETCDGLEESPYRVVILVSDPAEGRVAAFYLNEAIHGDVGTTLRGDNLYKWAAR